MSDAVPTDEQVAAIFVDLIKSGGMEQVIPGEAFRLIRAGYAAARASAQEAAQPVAWRVDDGCKNHHYTAESIAAIVRDLRDVERGEEMPEWINRDHRARCGILWRVISALSHDVPYAAPPAALAQPVPRISAEQIADWRMYQGEGWVSALGEYTPDEFWALLDDYERIAIQPTAPDDGAMPCPQSGEMCRNDCGQRWRCRE